MTDADPQTPSVTEDLRLTPPMPYDAHLAQALTVVDRQTLELVEERAVFGKRLVVTGRVRVSTATETVETLATGEVAREAVEVERVPVGVYVTEVPDSRVEGDVTILPVVEEVVVVEKRLMLVEEIHVRRVRSLETIEVPVSVRRQRAVVERIDPETGPS